MIAITGRLPSATAAVSPPSSQLVLLSLAGSSAIATAAPITSAGATTRTVRASIRPDSWRRLPPRTRITHQLGPVGIGREFGADEQQQRAGHEQSD